MRRIGILVVGLLVLGATPAVAGTPDVIERGSCDLSPAGAGTRLALTDLGDRIKVRFSLHQAHQPGHRWLIVIRHTTASISGPATGVIFRDIILARGSTAVGGPLILVTRRARDTTGFVSDVFKVSAIDQLTGEHCFTQAGIEAG
jgi:hypothetical protein